MAIQSIQLLREKQAALNSVIDSYIAALEQGTADALEKGADGNQVCNAASEIVDAFADPTAVIMNLWKFGMQPAQNVATRIAIDLDIFNLIDDRVTLDELLIKTRAEPELLLRILRLLVAIHTISEPEQHVYSATAVSKCLRIPSVRDWIKTSFDSLLPVWQATPKFLARTGFKDIADIENNPTVALHGCNFFEEIAKDPGREADFASAMKLQDHLPAASVPRFPYEESIEHFQKESHYAGSDVFLVDVGGGKGQYLDQLIKQNPVIPGRKVLQDLSSVIACVDQNGLAFELMNHNFFERQPIQGARFYHLRGILHDWPDMECVRILSQLRVAFKADYSRLLVHTFILPETSCSPEEAMMDITMWIHCGKERTESQFRSLLQKSGFEIVRIIRADFGPYGIIEASPSSD